MTSTALVPHSEEELRRFLVSMGPPPLLSTEDSKAFEELFLNIGRSCKVSDRLSLSLAWEIAVDTWESSRYVRHGAIAVDRWLRQTNENNLATARTMKATYEDLFRKKEEGISNYPGNAAELAKLQAKIDNTVKSIDAILAYVPTEVDFNRALRNSADLLHDFDQLRASANRRRFGNYMLLEKHGAQLDRAAQQADKVVDAEFKEVGTEIDDAHNTQPESAPLAIAISPTIVPTEDPKPNDIEPQNRSESTQ